MGKYEQLKTAISGVIKTNGNQEITGAVMQNALLTMINSLGKNYQFVGVASTNTNPGTPDQNVFYIANAGTYSNFNGAIIEDGQLGFLLWNGSWTKQTIEIGSAGGNFILDWNNNFSDTVNQLKLKYRKPGIQLSFKMDDSNWVNMQYVGIGIDNTNWGNKNLWKQIAITDDIGIYVQETQSATLTIGQILQKNVVNGAFIEIYSESELDKLKLVVGASVIASNKNYIYAKATANAIIIQNETQQYTFDGELRITYCNGVYERIFENVYKTNIFISDNKDNIGLISEKISFDDISYIGKNIANPENIIKGMYFAGNGLISNSQFKDISVDVSTINGEYITISNKSNSIRVLGYEKTNGEKVVVFNANTTTPYTYQIPSDVKLLHVSYGYSIDDLQVEKGKTATSYEPFIRCIKGLVYNLLDNSVSESKLTEDLRNKIDSAINYDYDFGVNLIDNSQIQKGKYFDIYGIASNAAFDCTKTNDISLLKGKQITISGQVSTSLRTLGYYDKGNKPHMILNTNTNLPYTFILPDDVYELYVSYAKKDDPKNIQINLGSSVLPYTDYQEPIKILPDYLYVVPSDKTVGLEKLTDEVRQLIVGGVSFINNYLYGKKIVAVGDSMVAGHTLSNNETWKFYVSNRNSMTLYNYGYNGRYLTARSIVSGTVKGVVDMYNEMENDADYIIVWAGTNDARDMEAAENPIQLGDENSEDTTTIYGALNVLCKGLQNKYPKGKILFINVFTRNTTSYPQVQKAIKDICAKFAIKVFNVAEESGISWKATEQTQLLTLNDTYHLSQVGNEFISYSIENILRGL